MENANPIAQSVATVLGAHLGVAFRNPLMQQALIQCVSEGMNNANQNVLRVFNPDKIREIAIQRMITSFEQFKEIIFEQLGQVIDTELLHRMVTQAWESMSGLHPLQAIFAFENLFQMVFGC